ncbi:cardiolipin synthase [Luteimonas cucumeris]|uniref:Cardiolipin synthase n=1 Tax=Luteimonas cucumeris TaxID=985012 RepID=A0A562KVU1_9GAMM|nr:cardiolipin synthase [Luteimonas cucumeris]TWH99484.1 cardiolipin synthase [Luteimonas cucumeris]
MLDSLQQAWLWLVSIPHLRLYLVLGWLTYLLWLGAWIVLQKREPVATLSWLLGLAVLPYVGFLVYHVFGPQKIKRHRLRRGRTQSARTELPAGFQPTPEAIELARLGLAATGLRPTVARDVRLLVDGGNKFEALLAAVAQAQNHVHLEYYIYAADRTGTMLRDALIERARAGVKVRLLLDAVGSGNARRSFFAPLLEAGGELCWFHPMRFGRVWQRPWLNMRSHRKIVVIDGRIAFTGGINITDDENDRLRSDAYRDLHLRLEGEAVRTLQLVFAEDWAYATGSRDFVAEVARATPSEQGGTIPAQVLTSGPDSSWEAIHRLHVSAIHEAQRRVWLVTPYFVPGEAAMMALTSAALGGLDVRLLVPKMSDSRLVTYAARSYFDDLLAAGVKVYEYGPRMLHTKALLTDDDLVMIGSANFDHRSFRLNFEVTMLFRDAALAAQLAALIESELSSAPRVRDDRARSLWRYRLPEALARLLSPLL